MDTPPRQSGDIEAYQFHIETCLHWLCERCGYHEEIEIRVGEEDAPYGPWQERQAREAMEEGWYVRPLGPSGSLLSTKAYCPTCAAAMGLQVDPEQE